MLTNANLEISVISYTETDKETKIKKVHSEVGRSRMDKAHGKSCTLKTRIILAWFSGK